MVLRQKPLLKMTHILFNQTTGDLITGDKQRRGTINKFDQTNKIGSKKWIDKWSK